MKNEKLQTLWARLRECGVEAYFAAADVMRCGAYAIIATMRGRMLIAMDGTTDIIHCDDIDDACHMLLAAM